MKTFATLTAAALVLAGCGKAPESPNLGADGYTRWHANQAKVVALQGQIIALEDVRDKINAEEEANCRKMTPPRIWAILGNVGPKCFTQEQVQQAQAASRPPAPPEPPATRK